jgi:N-ethylmaleimide reductase
MPSYDETFDTYDYLTKELNKLDILYVHLVESAARNQEEGRHLIPLIRENFNNILIVNGGYTQEKAEAVLAAGGADLVSFGTPFIANPDFPERMLKAIPLLSPDASTFYTPGEKGYTDYPLHHASEKLLNS